MDYTVLPVIHFQNTDQALRNAEIAFDAGCPGVLLISMDGEDELLGPAAKEVKRRWGDKLVGVNYLSLSALSALRLNLAHGFDLTWTDNAGVHSTGLGTLAHLVADELKATPEHTFFGACGFKGQRAEPDTAAAAVMAAGLRMLPTTSGSATGVAADLQKIRSIRAALGTGPLAVASGITPENVLDYAPFVSHFLVATGVSDDFYNFNFEKLAVLVSRLRNFSRAA